MGRDRPSWRRTRCLAEIGEAARSRVLRTSRFGGRALSAAVFAAIASSITPAAAEPTGTDRALATALFNEGRKLMADKKWAEACPKLAESQRLDPGDGTLLNLAICHEGEGRTASAFSEFNDALASALREDRTDREDLARAHIAALEGRLARMAVTLPETSRMPGIEVQMDGTVMNPAAWGTAVPVDPGVHEVVAKAPGRTSWHVSIEVLPGSTAQVRVPVLDELPRDPADVPSARALPQPLAPTAPAPSSQAIPSGPPPTNHGMSGRRAAAVVSGVAGLASIGLGAGFGLRAISQWHGALSHCPGPGGTGCDEAGVGLGRSASGSAAISTVYFVIGGVGLLAAGVLWFQQPARSKDRASPVWQKIERFGSF